MIAGMLLLGESMDIREIIGCVIVVAALLMYNKFERESEQAHV